MSRGRRCPAVFSVAWISSRLFFVRQELVHRPAGLVQEGLEGRVASFGQALVAHVELHPFVEPLNRRPLGHDLFIPRTVALFRDRPGKNSASGKTKPSSV